jgi:precorrin-3B methylase
MWHKIVGEVDQAEGSFGLYRKSICPVELADPAQVGRAVGVVPAVEASLVVAAAACVGSCLDLTMIALSSFS